MRTILAASFFWPALLCSLDATSAGGQPAAPASVRTVEAPREAPTHIEAAEVFVRIVSTDKTKSEMTVSLRGEELRVSVSSANAEIFSGGSLVRGFLVPSNNTHTLPLLDSIWPADSDTLQAQSDSLQALLTLYKTPAFRIGSGFHLPLEGFLDQKAKAVSSGRFRGKQIVLNFVYGRCGEPAMCPATANRMMRLRERLPSTTRNKTEIVFITLDPQFDTPARCFEYLKARGANIEGVSMLTGSNEAVETFSKLCGIWFKKAADGVLEHAQMTMWADASGTVRDAFPATDEGASSLEKALLLETAELATPAAR